jgi:hypothetical protein
VLHAAAVGFTNGINDLLVVTGIVAIVGAVAAFTLIRSRDFVGAGAPAAGPEHQPAPAAGASVDPAPA